MRAVCRPIVVLVVGTVACAPEVPQCTRTGDYALEMDPGQPDDPKTLTLTHNEPGDVVLTETSGRLRRVRFPAVHGALPASVGDVVTAERFTAGTSADLGVTNGEPDPALELRLLAEDGALLAAIDTAEVPPLSATRFTETRSCAEPDEEPEIVVRDLEIGVATDDGEVALASGDTADVTIAGTQYSIAVLVAFENGDRNVTRAFVLRRE
jgi:hypothetical protein